MVCSFCRLVGDRVKQLNHHRKILKFSLESLSQKSFQSNTGSSVTEVNGSWMGLLTWHCPHSFVHSPLPFVHCHHTGSKCTASGGESAVLHERNTWILQIPVKATLLTNSITSLSCTNNLNPSSGETSTGKYNLSSSLTNDKLYFLRINCIFPNL